MREFLEQAPEHMVGRLTTCASESHFFQQLHTQTSSWLQQTEILQNALRQAVASTETESWSVLLEYPIPRRGKRIDTVLLLPGCVLVIEFKCGATSYERSALAQVEDYCLDLRDFHRESRNLVIVPLLVATDGPQTDVPTEDDTDQVRQAWCANKEDLAEKVLLCSSKCRGESSPERDRWNGGEYLPTPTIIEAAQALYAGHNVREISRCHAGVDNLTETSDAVIQLVDEARVQARKLICFVTGIPGAGKTLAGLNVVHNHSLHQDDLGVFLSGNGPLVRVLTEALARDHRARTKSTLTESKRRVGTFVQNVHRFIGEYFAQPDRVPADHVVVFDEAQRAWNVEQSLRKFKRNFSEPQIMLEVMDRHSDWSVIVALVGMGQEINTGEAGLGEWGRALVGQFRHWLVAVSPELLLRQEDGQGLFPAVPAETAIRKVPSLHLNVTLRSFKGQQLSEFVNAVLTQDVKLARTLLRNLDQYPIAMTRSLEGARQWLRNHQRGTRRTGLVASSGGRRLLAYGLDVTTDLDVENWFLNSKNDVRSSFFLEVPATEFGIQGLELDWAGLCWDGDLVPQHDGWLCRKFRGTSWQQVRDEQSQHYVINKYRVLLTRAREGMVIWVPSGSTQDSTRVPETYDKIAVYLKSCGVPEF